MNSKLKDTEEKIKYNNIDSKHLNALSKNKYIINNSIIIFFISVCCISNFNCIAKYG